MHRSVRRRCPLPPHSNDSEEFEKWSKICTFLRKCLLTMTPPIIVARCSQWERLLNSGGKKKLLSKNESFRSKFFTFGDPEPFRFNKEEYFGNILIFPGTGFCFCPEVQSNEIKEKSPFRARGGSRRPNGAEEARKGKLVHKGLPKGKMVLNSGGDAPRSRKG